MVPLDALPLQQIEAILDKVVNMTNLDCPDLEQCG